jgi:hypothetical protein
MQSAMRPNSITFEKVYIPGFIAEEYTVTCNGMPLVQQLETADVELLTATNAEQLANAFNGMLPESSGGASVVHKAWLWVVVAIAASAHF